MPPTGPRRPRLIPPVVLFGSIVLMLVLHWLMPGGRWLEAPWTLAGVVIIGLGATLTYTGHGQFTARGTSVKHHEPTTVLVTDGVFRLSRNPMYVGLTTILLGIAVGLGTLTPVFVVHLFPVWLTRRIIPREEATLEQQFGEEYRAYKARVRRWL